MVLRPCDGFIFWASDVIEHWHEKAIVIICDIRFNCIHSLPTEDSIGHGPKGYGWRGWWQTFELLFFFLIFDCPPQDYGWRLWISLMTQKILDSRLVRCNQKIKDTHSIKAKRTSFPHSFFRSSWTTPTSWTTCSSLESSVITTTGGSVTIEM